MGGPFRAIVGGQASYRWAFPPAQAIRVNNHTTQYGHLIEIDEFVAPGQLGLVIPLENPLAGITFKFEPPPNATQAAATAGQVALVNTYDVAEVGVSVPPLGPDPGLLLPIGLDSPLHLHHFTNTHAHNPHSHGITGTHSHSIPNHNHSLGGPAAWISTGPGNGDGTFGTALSDHTHNFNGGSSGIDVTGNAVGLNTNASSPGPTDNANVPPVSPGDSDLENLQHTHP